MKEVIERAYNHRNFINHTPIELEFTENDTCFEYSENPELLKEILKDTKITVKRGGTEERMVAGSKNYYHYIEIERDGNTRFYWNEIYQDAAFKYSSSVHDYEQLNKGKEGPVNNFLYSILSCIGSDYHTNIENYPTFEDFCNDFGYDQYEDGFENPESLELYNQCIAHADGLKEVFTPEEIESFPS